MVFFLKAMNTQTSSFTAGQILSGRNPRQFFCPDLQKDLEESIRTQGVLQPILIRPIANNQFSLVAGERRLRAFKSVFGDNAEIPVLVRQMTDEEADAAALVENIERADMTPVEEAEAAARLLGQCKGDRDDTAKRLGWSKSTLDKRLALMYASEKVRAALQEKKIHLGHAELLSACRKESQDTALDHLLTQEKMMTVSELKAYLETNALHLDGAIFDKVDCTACHHNSGNQATLFAEAISGGRCTNKQCFDQKTEAKINDQVKVLSDEYQVVRIFRPGDNLTVINLVADGPKGVGQEQALACKVCKDYGAVISTVPDKLGREYKGMCMNVPCHTQHVAAKLKAENAASKAQASNPEPGTTDATPPTQAGSKEPKTATSAAAAKPATKPASSEPSNRVKEHREKLWRLIFEKAIAKLPVAENRMVLMALCLTNPSVLSKSALAKVLEPLLGSNASKGPADLMKAISNLDQAQLGGALNHIAACVNDGQSPLGIKDVTGILKFFNVKVENYWKVDKTFFDLLTKNELDAVCEEIGIKAAMGNLYAKARNGSKEEFTTAVLAVKDFEYRGCIPKLVSY